MLALFIISSAFDSNNYSILKWFHKIMRNDNSMSKINTTVPFLTSIKFQGIYIGNNLTYDVHLKHINKKILLLLSLPLLLVIP